MSKPLKAIIHGTVEGYRLEIHRGLATCGPCRAAVSDYNHHTPRERGRSPIKAAHSRGPRGEWFLLWRCPEATTAKTALSRLRRGAWPAYQGLPPGKWEYDRRNVVELWAIVERPPGVAPPTTARRGRPPGSKPGSPRGDPEQEHFGG